eukprot:1191551-Prorocentrum_minimum.AAC.2
MAALATAARTIAFARTAPVSAQRASFVGARVQAKTVHRATLATRAVTSAAYGKKDVGSFPSTEYRIFFTEGEKTISPWHDVPLYNDDGTLNAIIEIPKESKAKVRTRMHIHTFNTRHPVGHTYH